MYLLGGVPTPAATGHSGEAGQRRDPQSHVLAPVLGPGADQIHHPGLLEQPVQRLQPGQLPQAAAAARQPQLQYDTFKFHHNPLMHRV